MKTEQYPEIWQEAISDSFESAGVYSLWEGLTQSQRDTILQTSHSWMQSLNEQSSMQISYQTKGFENPDIAKLKKRVAELERDAEAWQNAFRKNVEMRHPSAYDIVISKDGNAEYRL